MMRLWFLGILLLALNAVAAPAPLPEKLSQQIGAEQQRVAAAIIAIPWSQLGKRTADWENYLTKYPTSPEKQSARCAHLIYQEAFLVGADNTGITQDDAGQKLTKEVKHAWRQFSRAYPKSPTTALIAQIQKAPPYNKRALDILKKQHKKQGITETVKSNCRQQVSLIDLALLMISNAKYTHIGNVSAIHFQTA